jgi:ABC-type dipeptide/oligopeptide/nickel transport system ATPase component
VSASLSIMRLIDRPGDRGKSGLAGKLVELDEHEMVHIRGNRISMIFQQPKPASTLCSRSVNRFPSRMISSLVEQGGRTRARHIDARLVGISEPERGRSSTRMRCQAAWRSVS